MAELSPDSPRVVTARRGRPRLYKDNAEKQRAHRQRVKQQINELKAQQSIPRAASATSAPRPDQPRTGREMLQILKANGFVGAWADRDDIGDSVEFARQLRRRVWSGEDR
jgi:hypothetical protein